MIKPIILTVESNGPLEEFIINVKGEDLKIETKASSYRVCINRQNSGEIVLKYEE